MGGGLCTGRAGGGRVRMVAVLKCRVSINGVKRGRGWDGCRSAPPDKSVPFAVVSAAAFAGGEGRIRGSEREQSASQGHDF